MSRAIWPPSELRSLLHPGLTPVGHQAESPSSLVATRWHPHPGANGLDPMTGDGPPTVPVVSSSSVSLHNSQYSAVS